METKSITIAGHEYQVSDSTIRFLKNDVNDTKKIDKKYADLFLEMVANRDMKSVTITPDNVNELDYLCKNYLKDTKILKFTDNLDLFYNQLSGPLLAILSFAWDNNSEYDIKFIIDNFSQCILYDAFYTKISPDVVFEKIIGRAFTYQNPNFDHRALPYYLIRLKDHIPNLDQNEHIKFDKSATREAVHALLSNKSIKNVIPAGIAELIESNLNLPSQFNNNDLHDQIVELSRDVTNLQATIENYHFDVQMENLNHELEESLNKISELNHNQNSIEKKDIPIDCISRMGKRITDLQKNFDTLKEKTNNLTKVLNKL
ncbi:hypothetical protein TRFO_18746 [Tritrichomonas foetus]|uniref:Uncharacterized protein n=1 Tax=Tritrichomonas foetus TaxID=1144522 RepID=A0A1J4KLD6_9EUKA|nr:hypothetical protein TRFO_18746 [Tritrichomonas foetus]|eukprot:OHT11760.1 hypothetical protein TRFO_18746 [Tritrichomonas foetus]